MLRQGAVDVAAVLSAVRPTGPSLEPEVLALSRLAPLLAVCCGNIESALNFVDDSLHCWASGGERVIIEVFEGDGCLSAAIIAEGLLTAPGFDILRITYGKRWGLSNADDQARWC